MTKATVSEIAQKLADLATEHSKIADKLNQLQQCIESALNSTSKVLENLPSKQEIEAFRNQMRNFASSRKEIKEIVIETIKEETKTLHSRINYPEYKVKNISISQISKTDDNNQHQEKR